MTVLRMCPNLQLRSSCHSWVNGTICMAQKSGWPLLSALHYLMSPAESQR